MHGTTKSSVSRQPQNISLAGCFTKISLDFNKRRETCLAIVLQYVRHYKTLNIEGMKTVDFSAVSLPENLRLKSQK